MNGFFVSLILSIAFATIAPIATHAQQAKLSWVDDVQHVRARVRRDPTYLAVPHRAQQNFSAFLANPFEATKFDGKAVVFDPNTLFALFPNIEEKGKPSHKLALSETGIWVFAKRSALVRLTTGTPEFSKAKRKLERTKRYFPLKNSGKYLTNSPGCNSIITMERSTSHSLEAKLEWGIASATYGGAFETKITEEFERGRNVTHQSFGLEGTDQFIEVIVAKVCGSALENKGRHFYDIYLNGQLLGSVAPETYSPKKYDIDKVSWRAKILCRTHRDSYHDYLSNVLDLPDEWLQVVSSLTGRWAKGFTDFENC